MPKVTAESLEPIHVRAGRALLNLSTKKFADEIGEPLTIDKLKAFEAGRPVSLEVRAAILEAFGRFGVELQNGGKPGARLIRAGSPTRS